VHVGVDQPRQDHRVANLDHPVPGRVVVAGDPVDHAAGDVHRGGPHALGGHDPAAPDHQVGHGVRGGGQLTPSSRSTGSMAK
jgi:hypothetical protein